MAGETNKLLVIQPFHPSSQSPSLLKSTGSQLGLSSYLFVALPHGPYPMISLNGAIIASHQVACFVHPIHSPKGRVFQIGYDKQRNTRESTITYFPNNQNIHKDFDQACQIVRLEYFDEGYGIKKSNSHKEGLIDLPKV